MNKVSVVIPAYNNEICVSRAIQSALDQISKPLEIIVVNDGSKDRTLEVIRAFGDRVIIIDQKNAGPAAARNAGMRQAKGEYIALLDADDYWEPNFLAETNQFLEENPSCSAVSVGWRENQINGEALECPGNYRLRDWVNQPNSIINQFFDFWAEYDHIRTGTVLFRRIAFLNIGGQMEDLRISEDLEFWAMLATEGNWGFIPQVLWIGDSQRISAQCGWMEHYRVRYQNAPTIEQWQRRLLLHGVEKHKGFRQIRGRIARTLAHSNLLVGRLHVAQDYISKYGIDFGNDRLSSIMKALSKFDMVGLVLLYVMVQIRERSKAVYASIITK